MKQTFSVFVIAVGGNDLIETVDVKFDGRVDVDANKEALGKIQTIAAKTDQQKKQAGSRESDLYTKTPLCLTVFQMDGQILSCLFL